MSVSTLAKPVNNFSAALATAHAIADSQLVLATGSGALLGTLAANRVYRVTAVQAPGTAAESVLGIFEATGLTGDTLTGVTAAEGFSDVALSVGVTIQVRITAKYLSELQTALNALEVLSATTVYTTSSNADPAWITSLSGAKVSGNIPGNAASITGTITESQVTGLVSDLAAKAPLASPALTGTPTAPTPLTADNSTKLATTAFVVAQGFAVDSGVVHNTGTETIGGAKTFSTAPVLATLTGILKAATGVLSIASAGTDYLTPTGNGSGLTSLTAANISGTVAIANGGTGQASASAGFNALSPLTTTGDLIYASATNTAARLAGPTSSTKQFLTSTGTGTVAQAPAWSTIAIADITTALGTGIAGGQTITGGTASGNSLTLQGSANSTKGPVIVQGDGSSDIARFVIGGAGSANAGYASFSLSGGNTIQLKITNPLGQGLLILPSGIGIDNITGFSNGGAFNLIANNGTANAYSIKCPNVSNSSFFVSDNSNNIRMDVGASGLVGIGTTAAAALGTLHVRSASGSTSPLVIDTSSSTATAAALPFKANSSTTASRAVAVIDAVWATSTDASRKGRLVLSAADATANREGIRIESDGSNPLLGLFGATAVGKPTVTGSRGGNAALASLLTALANLGAITDSTSA